MDGLFFHVEKVEEERSVRNVFGMSGRQTLFFWVIIGLALWLRVFLMIGSESLVTEYDDKMYLQSARVLLETGMFTFGSETDQPTVFIPPLFTLYLAGVFALFGSEALGLVMAQVGVMAMGLAVIVLIVRMGVHLQKPRAGLFAGAVVAVYPPLVLHHVLYLTETMFTVWTLLFFLTLFAALEQTSGKKLLLTGVWLGLATLTRPTFALFPAVVGLYLWGRSDYRWKRALVVGAALVGVLVVLLSPWIVRNYVAFDRFIPLTKASGNPFLTGTYVNHDVWANGPDEEFPDYPKGWKKVPGDLLATDDRLMAIGMERLEQAFAKDPWAVVQWYTVGKFTLFWGHVFDWKDTLQPGVGVMEWVHRVLMGLAVVGVVVAVRRKVPYVWLLVLWLGYFTVVHLVYVALPRYALPVLPIVFLLGGLLFDTQKGRDPVVVYTTDNNKGES